MEMNFIVKNSKPCQICHAECETNYTKFHSRWHDGGICWEWTLCWDCFKKCLREWRANNQIQIVDKAIISDWWGLSIRDTTMVTTRDDVHIPFGIRKWPLIMTLSELEHFAAVVLGEKRILRWIR